MRRVLWVMISAFLVGTAGLFNLSPRAQSFMDYLPPNYIEGDIMELDHP